VSDLLLVDDSRALAEEISVSAKDDCLRSAKQRGIQEVLAKPLYLSVFLGSLTTLLQAA
jgi:hypothetical protein